MKAYLIAIYGEGDRVRIYLVQARDEAIAQKFVLRHFEQECGVPGTIRAIEEQPEITHVLVIKDFHAG